MGLFVVLADPGPLLVASALLSNLVSSQQSIDINWKRHPVTGIQVTLMTLAVVWGWVRFVN